MCQSEDPSEPLERRKLTHAIYTTTAHPWNRHRQGLVQIHAVDPETREIERRKLNRNRVGDFFAARERSLVAMGACGSAHH